MVELSGRGESAGGVELSGRGESASGVEGLVVVGHTHQSQRLVLQQLVFQQLVLQQLVYITINECSDVMLFHLQIKANTISFADQSQHITRHT